MPITPEQKAQLREDGFLVLPGAVAPELIKSALQTINYKLGEGISPEKLAIYKSQSFFPEMQGEKLITDLFNESDVRPALQELLGEAHVPAATGGQLALRFPWPVGTRPSEAHPHIDGMYSPNNGVPKGTLKSFTALVGVFLTDIDADYAGNLTVWPGSHLKMQDFFREHGVEALLQEGHVPKLDYGPPFQVKAKAGDAIIAHYQLLHGVTMNIAPMPRFATFFRVRHPESADDAYRTNCLTNLWSEWPGVQ